jgi:acetolactate synthase small subunit
MSSQDPLPLGLPQPPSHPETVARVSQVRQQEADLLRRLQVVRSAPELMVVRQLLAVRLALCQGRLVKASLNDVALLQGEARTLERLISELSGDRAMRDE